VKFLTGRTIFQLEHSAARKSTFFTWPAAVFSDRPKAIAEMTSQRPVERPVRKKSLRKTTLLLEKIWIGWPANQSRFYTKTQKRRHVNNLDSPKKLLAKKKPPATTYIPKIYVGMTSKITLQVLLSTSMLELQNEY
jgi:hypothetical protein